MITAGSATPAWGSPSLTLQRQSIGGHWAWWGGPAAAPLPQHSGQQWRGVLCSCRPRANTLLGDLLRQQHRTMLQGVSTNPAKPLQLHGNPAPPQPRLGARVLR